jgi:hypothetical protein
MVSRKEWGELLKLSKGDISLMVGLLTGHDPLRKHLKIIGLRQTPADSVRRTLTLLLTSGSTAWH